MRDMRDDVDNNDESCAVLEIREMMSIMMMRVVLCERYER